MFRRASGARIPRAHQADRREEEWKAPRRTHLAPEGADSIQTAALAIKTGAHGRAIGRDDLPLSHDRRRAENSPRKPSPRMSLNCHAVRDGLCWPDGRGKSHDSFACGSRRLGLWRYPAISSLARQLCQNLSRSQSSRCIARLRNRMVSRSAAAVRRLSRERRWQRLRPARRKVAWDLYEETSAEERHPAFLRGFLERDGQRYPFEIIGLYTPESPDSGNGE